MIVIALTVISTKAELSQHFTLIDNDGEIFHLKEEKKT